MTSPSSPPIRDNPLANRFELVVDGHVAVATYALSGATLTFIHTEVPEALQGRGIARQMAEFALASARQRGLKVVAQCTFFEAYMRKHVQTHDLLADPHRFDHGA